VKTLCIDSKVGLGVVAKRYPTAVRNKTKITCVHGPIATFQPEQLNTLCIDSKAGLGVVAKGLSRCCVGLGVVVKGISRCCLSLTAAVQTGACQLSLCPEIGEISVKN